MAPGREDRVRMIRRVKIKMRTTRIVHNSWQYGLLSWVQTVRLSATAMGQVRSGENADSLVVWRQERV